MLSNQARSKARGKRLVAGREEGASYLPRADSSNALAVASISLADRGSVEADRQQASGQIRAASPPQAVASHQLHL